MTKPFDQFLYSPPQFGKTIFGNLELSSDYLGFDGLIISGLDVFTNLLLEICSVHEAVVRFRGK